MIGAKCIIICFFAWISLLNGLDGDSKVNGQNKTAEEHLLADQKKIAKNGQLILNMSLKWCKMENYLFLWDKKMVV